MADAIQRQVKALLSASLGEAKGQEMMCDAATYKQAVERAEKLILDLTGEEGSLSFTIGVLCLASLRVQVCSQGTWDMADLMHWLHYICSKTDELGRKPEVLVPLINAIIEEHDKPKLPPEIRR